MSRNDDYDRRRRRGPGRLGAVGLGLTTGLASGFSLLLARKLGPIMDAGHGHPLKHRVWMQPPRLCSGNIPLRL